MTNKSTDEANYNERSMEDILQSFHALRNKTIAKLQRLTEEEIYKVALHPRLQTSMGLMDLFRFVAEHDDHHLAQISELNRVISS